MTLVQAVVLGLVQGLTEFLPISSTAHLRIVPALLGWDDPGAAYSAVIQLGTTAAVLVYFGRELLSVVRAGVQGMVTRQPLRATPQTTIWWCMVLGTIPIGVAGLALKPLIETTLRSLNVIAMALVAFGLLLWWIERRATGARTISDLSLLDGIVVGVWQAFALIPGASRSGVTLTGAMQRGLIRADAARFSFLLSIPATLLAGLFEAKHLYEAENRPRLAVVVVGVSVAFVSGMAAIDVLLRYLRRRGTALFVWYRIVAGVAIGTGSLMGKL